ncbi:MAG: AtpZ/AtpI family protein [Clostridia bacterium]
MSDKDKYKHMRAAAWITQFGLSMVSPIILCVIFALWINNTFNTGTWVVIVGMLLGVAASFTTMASFIKTVKKEMEDKEDDKKRSN